MFRIKSALSGALTLALAISTVSCRSTSVSNASLSSDKQRAVQSPNQAAKIPQIVRFAVWLDVLDKDMAGMTPEASAEKLVAGSARSGVFNLQGLARLYSDTDPKFDKARKRFKALEDGIGAYIKWDDLLEKAKKNKSADGVLKKLNSKRAAAKEALEKVLVSEKYIPKDGGPGYLTEFRAFLYAFPWKTVDEDRKIMLSTLSAQLEEIKSTSYDFTHLENGNGIHEFRRKLRWFSMEARALNGLVVLKPIAEGCPVEAYKDLPTSEYAKSKYGVLPSSAIEADPVPLTPCLYVKIAAEIARIGAIKDGVEEVDNNTEAEASDGASHKEQDAVRAVLEEMLSKKVFDLLQAELALGSN